MFDVIKTKSQSIPWAATCTEVRVYTLKWQCLNVFARCLPGILKIHVNPCINPVVHPRRKLIVHIKAESIKTVQYPET